MQGCSQACWFRGFEVGGVVYNVGRKQGAESGSDEEILESLRRSTMSERQNRRGAQVSMSRSGALTKRGGQ